MKVLERVDFSDDENDDNFKYEIVDEDDFREDDADDDDLAEALASLQSKQKSNDNDFQTATTTQIRPSVVDDFVRNFLIKAGLNRSLDAFNIEWYELQSKGKLSAELSTPVPDIYLRNEELFEQTSVLREQVEKMRDVAGRAQSTWDKFRKERDYHRMHHKRVVQEKNKLINDLKRLRTHLRSYEPTIDELKRRHEVAMKEKMMIRLERDRLKARVKVLEEQVTFLHYFSFSSSLFVFGIASLKGSTLCDCGTGVDTLTALEGKRRSECENSFCHSYSAQTGSLRL